MYNVGQRVIIVNNGSYSRQTLNMLGRILMTGFRGRGEYLVALDGYMTLSFKAEEIKPFGKILNRRSNV